MNTTSLAPLCVIALSLPLAAQTYTWSPPNTARVPGGSNTTIPFWCKSATYQQVHEAATMGAARSIKGMGMRPIQSTTVKGRSWAMRVTLGHTSATATTAATAFPANLGANPTIVFGKANTWQTFSFRDFTAVGTTPAFTIPFTNPFLYSPSTGNMCWEWRMKDNSDLAFVQMDSSGGHRQKGTLLPSLGTGCTPTGRSGPAAAWFAPYFINPTQWGLEISLTGAPRNTAAVLALGLNGSTTSIGWCGPVIAPQLLVPVQTDSNGGFGSVQSIADLAGVPPTTFYLQFGFTDAGIPGGIGVSDVAAWKSPDIPGAQGQASIYSHDNTANGAELALIGTRTPGNALSVAWLD